MSRNENDDIMALVETVAELRAEFMVVDQKSIAPQKYREMQNNLRRMERLLEKKRKERRDKDRKAKREYD